MLYEFLIKTLSKCFNNKISGIQALENTEYFKTGIKSFDEKFNGLKSGLVYLISGEEKSGKTSLALQIACIASSINFRTYILDCGGHIHYLRLSKIASNWNADLSQLWIAFPHSLKEQERTIVWVADMAPDNSLVVVDDFTYLHRIQMTGNIAVDKSLFHSLAFQLAYLKEACKTRGLTSILITDVYDVPTVGVTRPVASAITTYFSDIHLTLISESSNVKILKVLSGSSPAEFRVKIHEGGISDA